MHCNCVIYKNISKIKEVDDSGLICSCCPLINEYRELVKNNQVNFVEDLIEFGKSKDNQNDKKNKRRRKRHASSNKGNKNRTISKGGKKSKDK